MVMALTVVVANFKIIMIANSINNALIIALFISIFSYLGSWSVFSAYFVTSETYNSLLP